jgi:LAGLIDADG endonuclease
MDEINSIKLGMNSKRSLTVNSNNPKLSALSDETSVDSYNLNSLSDEENSKLNGSTRKSLNSKAQNIFAQKLVGITDSDFYDSFCIEKIKGNFILKYQISQNIYNLRLLYHIKTNLGYGRVLKLESKKLAFFIIKDRNILKEQIFPIFDKYPLYSSKYFSYLRFKEVLCILENNNLTTIQKNKAIENLLNTSLFGPNEISSPAISYLNENSNIESIKSSLSMH